ncbi:MAG: hypothetical protein ACT4OS_09555 [Acidimicrobiales bacterium]
MRSFWGRLSGIMAIAFLALGGSALGGPGLSGAAWAHDKTTTTGASGATAGQPSPAGSSDINPFTAPTGPSSGAVLRPSPTFADLGTDATPRASVTRRSGSTSLSPGTSLAPGASPAAGTSPGAGTMPTTGTASMTRTGGSGGSLWPWIPAVALGSAGIWLLFKPRAADDRLHRRDWALAGALMLTGVIHCLETPSHWDEGWHLGVFFAVSAAVLLGQAAAAGTRPTPALYTSVLATMVGLIVLYVLVRQFSLPLVDHRDPYLLTDLPVKLVEVGAAGLAGFRLFQMRKQAANGSLLAVA